VLGGPVSPWEVIWPSSLRRSAPVDAIVLHSIGGPSAGQALNRLEAAGVSAHYVIDQEGELYLLVAEDEAAWHAGGGRLPPEAGPRALNGRSIGIELVVESARAATYSAAQLATLEHLVRAIGRRHPIAWLASHEAVDRRRLTPRQPPDVQRTDPWRLPPEVWARLLAALTVEGPALDVRLDV
jgi:N-acetylmuramoyl-L-alanine amidase